MIAHILRLTIYKTLIKLIRYCLRPVNSSSCLQMFFRKGVLENVSFSVKKTPTQVFSCEFGKIFKNSFFYRTPLVTASIST